jgi:hypothetical protein
MARTVSLLIENRRSKDLDERYDCMTKSSDTFMKIGPAQLQQQELFLNHLYFGGGALRDQSRALMLRASGLKINRQRSPRESLPKFTFLPTTWTRSRQELFFG